MSKLTDNVEKIVVPKADILGLELEYVELSKEGGNNILRVVVSKKEGNIDIEDCANLSRSIDEEIETVVKIDGEYVLEVASAGIERQLKNTKLFNKYIGEKVIVKLFNKLNDVKEYVGILKEVDEDKILLEVEENELVNDIVIDRKNIAAANTVYNFEF